MKKFFFGLSVLIVTCTTVNAQVKIKADTTKAKAKVTMVKKMPIKPAVPLLKNENDSFSYALGLNIGNNLKEQGLDGVNYSVMQKALDDVNKKNPVLLDQTQANKTIQQRLKTISDKKAAKAKQEGEEFLVKNSKRPEVITLPDGLQYEILKKSDSVSASPKEQDTVIANYKGTLVDGTEFDNSYKRGQPLTVPVSGVILGWTEILQLMHIGDKYKVYIPSKLGYGERGAGASIPGGATLIFEMELLGIKPGKAK
jgi:FKBP-type peptidyl-prolyl cis-trans isomerase FklB